MCFLLSCVVVQHSMHITLHAASFSSSLTQLLWVHLCSPSRAGHGPEIFFLFRVLVSVLCQLASSNLVFRQDSGNRMCQLLFLVDEVDPGRNFGCRNGTVLNCFLSDLIYLLSYSLWGIFLKSAACGRQVPASFGRCCKSTISVSSLFIFLTQGSNCYFQLCLRK